MSYENLQFAPREVDEDSVVILKALLEAGDRYVSGSLLAEQLGVSRPAVHGKLDKLREEGFEVDAVRNRGYRIKTLPEVLHPALLRCTLEGRGSKIGLRYFPVLDSTNSEAERRIASGESSPFAIVSSCQTNGRGRLGRVWQSNSADNLYLSVGFEPNIPPQQLQHFTLWAGICICRQLQGFVPKAPLKIKWPNDLHCMGRKFAGMLTEAKLDADRIRSIIFGLGLNVNGNPNDFPDEVRPLATSLHAIHGETLPLNDVAAVVICAIEEAYQTCIQETDTTDKLSDAWEPLDALAGQQVTAIQQGVEITGIASGIDEGGALLLLMPDGSQKAIRAGDVTLKK
ncbi:biotin--[acetyl-CoA-carboxylase] ligase [Coraliomargarita sinensis]|uniref:Bifunctional ligase/repressor BirA n=1 Tax=Coraliomargarita sinensis TaxID=2174842 RepID=A0A317ZIT0_9BACT|nr:biotin--[acetyl-CoA-carboxylase] ligase [Coraliomargarita sinensis]PXA05486.1 biotin--[acetyl-CoA-carboxylase] ligase [Coraliomargarita sinensis]